MVRPGSIILAPLRNKKARLNQPGLLGCRRLRDLGLGEIAFHALHDYGSPADSEPLRHPIHPRQQGGIHVAPHHSVASLPPSGAETDCTH